jgi:subtilisin-like proprotein convertase family protein
MRILLFLPLILLLNVQYAMAQCTLALGADTAVFCEGSCTTLDAGNAWTSILWSTGETTTAICAQQTGWHVATVTDAFACAASDSVFVIRLIHSANAEEQEVCAGQFVEMRGLLSAEIQSIGSYNQITYLPDGSGVNYETNILVEDMPVGSVYEGGAGFLEICVNMEHSYLGDLEMMLTCPNGTSVNIFNAYTGNGLFPGGTGGGGTYLGQALDNGNGTPGVGWDYCFSDMATWGTLGNEYDDGNTVPAGGTTPGNAMAPGTYLPEDSFAALIGCPLNGDWTITIRDNQGIDDGYIMFWGIGIATDLGPVDYSWSNGDVSQTITAPVTETEMWVDMTLQGVTCTDTVSFTVNPLPEVILGIFNSDCNSSNGEIELLFGDSMIIFLLSEPEFPYASLWSRPRTL